ncbi:MAG: hypothetical protein Q4G26_15140, partial [Paracoccus sp. (in: a-proteobacteria)]|nr:hypothetical protein [Paracoccus sp. (in: a-proteobacteria)]
IEAFADLSRARSIGPNGPNPISWADLEAYARITRQHWEPRHYQIVMALDRVWLDHVHAERGKDRPDVKTLPPISTHPLTAQLLDVMMG